MAAPIRSGRQNGLIFRRSTDLTLGSGTITSGNTNRVFRPNRDGTWSSYRPGRAINAFSSMTRIRQGTEETLAAGSGQFYLVDASANNEVPEQAPIATVAEGSPSSPSSNADDVTYIHTISGFDRIPNFALRSGTTVNSAQTGNWSDGSTWVGGSVPAAGTIARVRNTHVVTLNTTTNDLLVCSTENGGTLKHSRSVNSNLRAREVQVRENGTYDAGTVADPIPLGVTAKITILNVAIDTATSTFDPNQYGNGLVVLGTFTACGYDRGLSYLRSSHERSAGNTTITLTAPATNWQAGDRLFVPDSRQITEAQFSTATASQAAWASNAQWEVRTLSSKSGDSLTLTLSGALTYDHVGPRDDAGTLETGLLWHVYNLTRNVVVESESLTGTRGHVLWTGHAKVDVRNALFYGLGRTTHSSLNNTTFDGSGNPTAIGTNQIGRYPAHFHHCGGRDLTSHDGGQWTWLFLNNAIDGGDDVHDKKWGLTVHGTHWGLARNNVCHNVFGAGYVFEDGTETQNWLDASAAVRVPGLLAREDADSSTTGFARNGTAVWVRTGLSRVTDCVSANTANYSFVWNAIFLGTVTCPVCPGQHMHDGALSGGVSCNGYRLGVFEFDGFEAHSYGTGGATFWWVNTSDAQGEYTAHKSVFKDFKIWHTVRHGVYNYPVCQTIFDGWVTRHSTSILAAGATPESIHPGDYHHQQFVVRNCDLQGCYVGINCSQFTADNYVIEGCTVRAVKGVRVWTPESLGGGIAFSPQIQLPRVVHIENCDLTCTATVVSGSPAKHEVDLNFTDNGEGRNHVVQNDVYVYSRNGVAGDDYRLYSTYAASGATLSQTVDNNRIGCPEPGLTNAQAQAKYEPWEPGDAYASPGIKPDNPNPNTPGLAYGGTVAPAGTTTPSWTNGLAEAI